jgi:hypothetical protein
VSTISERVAAGAAFLDEHDPEWWRADVERAIDLETLRLSNPRRCILGQRCPLEFLTQDTFDDSPYRAFAKRLSGLDRGYQIGAWAAERGFDIDGSDDDEDEFADLTAEWSHVITGRRAAS